MNTSISYRRNSRVRRSSLISPNGIRLQVNCPPSVERVIEAGRAELADIMWGTNPRMAVIVGPCSVHDTQAAFEYTRELKARTTKLDKLFPIFRLPGEKPRTGPGWPGLILNSKLNLNADGGIEPGLLAYRQLLLQVAAEGGLIATEMLDTDLIQYFDDLLVAVWVGARSVTNQQHRFVSSALAMPVLFKHGLTGNINDALNAIKVARTRGNLFPSIDDDGNKAQFDGDGNPDCSVVLRGGDNGTNYDDASIIAASSGSNTQAFVDCSHANSGKDPLRQPDVARAAARAKKRGLSIGGILFESYFETGAQSLKFDGTDNVDPRKSVTDGCLGLEATIDLLKEINDILS